jgi:hypothetical protein
VGAGKFTELENLSFASPSCFISHAPTGSFLGMLGVHLMFDFQLILGTSAIATLSKERGVLYHSGAFHQLDRKFAHQETHHPASFVSLLMALR